MTSLAVAVDPSPLRVHAQGVVRIGGTRVSLDSIVDRHRQGESPAEIHESFPAVSLADVHAALAYYLRHQDEVESYLAEREAAAERIRRQVDARPESQALRAKLLAARRSRR